MQADFFGRVAEGNVPAAKSAKSSRSDLYYCVTSNINNSLLVPHFCVSVVCRSYKRNFMYMHITVPCTFTAPSGHDFVLCYNPLDHSVRKLCADGYVLHHYKAPSISRLAE